MTLPRLPQKVGDQRGSQALEALAGLKSQGAVGIFGRSPPWNATCRASPRCAARPRSSRRCASDVARRSHVSERRRRRCKLESPAASQNNTLDLENARLEGSAPQGLYCCFVGWFNVPEHPCRLPMSCAQPSISTCWFSGNSKTCSLAVV